MLPRKEKLRDSISGKTIEVVMEALYGTMEKLYSKGSNGGLRQLTVPTRDEGNRWRSSTEFIENVMRFCPNIEFLDGCKEVYHDSGQGKVWCEEQWMISLETWEAFCATCTKLRSFDWPVVPYAEPYFRAFGAYPKPQLKRLNISNLMWDWEEYFLGCGDRSAASNHDKDGYGKRATDARDVLKGCPGLTRLYVHLDYLREQQVDNTTFGDEFWVAVSTHCPQLESILIGNSSSLSTRRVKPLESLTDVALVSLGDLQHLTSTEFQMDVMCTGDGIFEHFRRVLQHRSSSGELWSLCFGVGGREHGDSGVPLFYDAVATLLKRLSATTERELGLTAGRKIELNMENPYRFKADQTRSAAFMRNTLKPLLERVRAMYPTLSINATVNGLSGDSFQRVEYFTIESRPEGGREREMFVDYGTGGLYNEPSDTSGNTEESAMNFMAGDVQRGLAGHDQLFDLLLSYYLGDGRIPGLEESDEESSDEYDSDIY